MQMIIITLLSILSALTIWQFVGYPLLMGIVALGTKPKAKDRTHAPFVSVIVPAYNEELVIEKRIENLDALDYPKDKYEIIVVESGSTDATAQIVERQIAQRGSNEPRLRLEREVERRGKASAINFGKKQARGEIILVTDANATFSNNVLKEMLPHFADPQIGAVGGRYAIANPDDPLASEESFYWEWEYIMRRGESALDSACLFHGEINAWRKHLAAADTGIISEDLDMAIQIRRKGYRIAYEPSAVAYEYTGTTPKDQIIRRRKVSTGTLLCIRKHLGYFLFPRDLYSLLIFPSHKGLVMLSPIILMAIALLYLISRDLIVISIHLVASGLTFAILFGALLFIKNKVVQKQSKPGKKFSIGSLIKIAQYVLLNEYLLLLAWKDFVFGKHTVLWERADSTRATMNPIL